MTAASFPVPRTNLPGLPPLLDGSLWRTWVEQGRVFSLDDFRTAVRYVRLKPKTSCRVVVLRPETATGADDLPPALLLHLYADRDRAAEAFRKVEGRRAGKGLPAYPPFLDETRAVVVAPFALDPELPALRDFHRPFRLRAALTDLLVEFPPEIWRVSKNRTRLRLLAYKPGRRAVFRAVVRLKRLDGTDETLLPLHLQVEHPATLDRSHKNLCRVHEALPSAAAWSVPTPLGVVEDRCLLASSWELGSPLTEVMGSSSETAMLAGTARALAGLHRLDIEPTKAVAAQRSSGLLALARDLADLLPDEESRILVLGERLAGLAAALERSGPVVPTHGDFHPGQVLLQDGRVVLVDFDRAGHEHAAADVGSFVARLIEAGRGRRSIDRFVNGYRAAAARNVRDADVDAAVAIALFRRASVPFRELAADWPDRVRDRLRQAEEAAESAR